MGQVSCPLPRRRERGRDGANVCSEQIDVRPFNERALNDTQIRHQGFGDVPALASPLIVTEDDLQLDKVAESIDLVKMNTCLPDEKERSPFPHDTVDAERCGDLAKSIAKAAGLADAPREGPHAETLRQLRDRVRPMFAHTCEAVTSGDADAARQVMLTNDELKGAMADLLGAIAHDGALTPNAATVLTLTTRMIGRVASHLSNIASAVALPFDLVRSGPEAQAAPSA